MITFITFYSAASILIDIFVEQLMLSWGMRGGCKLVETRVDRELSTRGRGFSAPTVPLTTLSNYVQKNRVFAFKFWLKLHSSKYKTTGNAFPTAQKMIK